VVNGCCERCGTKVEKREKEQWMLAITKYAERLDKDLDDVDYLEKIKIQQRNWIGRSEGTLLKFPIYNSESSIEVFTTRADTLFGVTYVVLAPEHELVKKIIDEHGARIPNLEKIKKYISEVRNKTEIERVAEDREKTGIEIEGIRAINPANNEKVPVFIADYVLANYGTGAVMAVPAHDERDFAFAKKYNLPIKQVISGGNISEKAFIEEGKLINSENFDGMESEEAIKEITKKFGKKVVKFKLRDWVFSRQRYWGEPIPVVHCPNCGIVPLPETGTASLSAIDTSLIEHDFLPPLYHLPQFLQLYRFCVRFEPESTLLVLIVFRQFNQLYIGENYGYVLLLSANV